MKHRERRRLQSQNIKKQGVFTSAKLLLLLLLFSVYKLTDLRSRSAKSRCLFFTRPASESGIEACWRRFSRLWGGGGGEERVGGRGGREGGEGERLLARNSNNTFFKGADGKFQRILPSSLLMIRLLQIYDSLHESSSPLARSPLARSPARYSHSLSVCVGAR